jgi:hypothetical protein
MGLTMSSERNISQSTRLGKHHEPGLKNANDGSCFTSRVSRLGSSLHTRVVHSCVNDLQYVAVILGTKRQCQPNNTLLEKDYMNWVVLRYDKMDSILALDKTLLAARSNVNIYCHKGVMP